MNKIIEENDDEVPENIIKLHDMIMDHVNKSHVKMEHFFSYICLLLVRSLVENGFEKETLDRTCEAMKNYCEAMKNYFDDYKGIYAEKMKQE